MEKLKTSSDKYTRLLDIAIKAIEQAAKEYEIHPQQVTKFHFFNMSPDITDWELRTIGGLTGIKNAHFPMNSKDIAVKRQAVKKTSYVNKLFKEVGDWENFKEQVLSEVREAVKSIKIPKIDIKKQKQEKSNKHDMTMELMLSDIHLGKKSKTFNTEVCKRRIDELVETFIREFNDNNKLFNVHRVILALLGDMISNATFHGVESAMEAEYGNSKQIVNSVNLLFTGVLLPIARLGVKIDVPAVTGNHDRPDVNKTYNNPGENHLTWIIYKMLELLCKTYKLDNVKFHIPDGSYIVLPIYDNYCLYEHGDNNKKNSKDGFMNLINKRSKQEKKMIDFGRFGHYHEYHCFGRGIVIINESICGPDSFSDIHGYTSTAGQTINYYVKTDKRPSCFYKSFPVYLE